MSESKESGKGSAEAASNQEPTQAGAGSREDGMKRAAAKELLEKYFFQLTDGCGQPDCSNPNCASCPDFSFRDLSRNEAFLKAIDLLQKKVSLCGANRPKIAKASPESSSHKSSSSKSSPTTGPSGSQSCAQPSTSGQEPPLAAKSSNSRGAVGTSSKPGTEVDFLTEETVNSLLAVCQAENNWSVLIRTIGSVYSKPESLLKSFRKETSKEALHSMEEDADKDIDTSEESSSSNPDQGQNSEKGAGCLESAQEGTSTVKPACTMVKPSADAISVDLESLSRTYAKLFAQQDPPFQNALIHAISALAGDVEMELKYYKAYERNPDYLNIFVIIMEIPVLQSPEFIDIAFPQFCKAMGELPLEAQVKLTQLWATYRPERLKDIVGSLQQLISVKVISTPWQRLQMNQVQDSGPITGATKVLSIAYYASILGGSTSSEEQIQAEKAAEAALEVSMNELYQNAMGHDPKEREKPREDPLGVALGVRPMDCYKPLVSWEDYINEPLSDLDLLLMEKDYYNYRTDTNGKFSFLHYPFILTAGAKHLGLYFDNKVRMLHERRSTMFQTIMNGTPGIPYLRLKVRRDHLIVDALLGLEMAAMDNPQDLKKQLYVEFDGEEGVDEGGVSKEFFQLIVEEIFNPDIGMFIFDEETQTFWFNSTSFENDGQFTLIGIILGLAIYNNVILDVHFPMVVYKKLMGKMGTFHDLIDSHPTLAKGLQELLDFDGNVEETFMQTFQVSYKDVFGNTLTHCLAEGGESKPVTNENRPEFVKLYADFLLNKSVERQFRAFKRGFQMVTDESPLRVFFRPEEVELLVCGSKDYDFNALEQSADYDGGFTEHSRTIKHFWEVVHEFTDEQKRQLLQFTTGSDRVPVGGLSKLKLIIAKNGPDSDRLPTSHTCFNVLLLPDYSNKEKLKERLLKAITHAKGFGML